MRFSQTIVCEMPCREGGRSLVPILPECSRKPFSDQVAENGEFREVWTVASGKNRVRVASGKAMKP